MRERHIFWDLAPVALLALLVIFNGITLIHNNRFEKQVIDLEISNKQLLAQNREIISKLDAGVKFQGTPAEAVKNGNSSVNSGSDEPITPVGGTLYLGDDLPKVPHGDENADDGDWLILNEGSEPNSLNPLIDNDATASDLFDRANDHLVSRCFDDFKFWEPKLARAWEKSMVCRGLARSKNAKELAAKLNTALSADAKKNLSIANISAESDDVLRIELGDVNGEYRDEVQKILGPEAIDKQYWIYVSFEGDKFADGSEITAASLGKRLEDIIQKAGFKGRVLPRWERESSVVVQVTGDGQAAVKAIKDFIGSDANKGEITDPKSPTGKRMDKVLVYDVMEEYVFEEKPVFTFHIRKNVKWHDGKPFTGKDVVFSFNTVMNPKVEAAPQRNYLQDCEICKLVNDDPYKVQFVWKKPYFLAFNFAAGLDILPEHLFKFTDPEVFNKGPQNQQLVGTGPYRLEKWERKSQFIFTRNEDYYGAKPHFKKVVYKLVEDRTVGIQLLQAGNLDVQSLTKSQAREKGNDPEFMKKFNINVSVANVYRYLGWNARKDIFASAKVRRALTMLVDRKRIIEDAYRGYALPLNGPAHPDSPSYSPDIEKFAVPYAPKEAMKILAEEGWKDTDGDGILDKNGQPFKFTLLYVSGSPEYESVGNLIKDSFARAGIVVTPSNLEWSVLLQKIERLQFDAIIMAWRLGLEDDPYQLWHSSQTGEKASNHCAFINKEADRLIEEGRRELNETRRGAMFQKVNEIIAQEQPYTFLLVDKRTVGYDRRINNVVYKLPGSESERWWVPKEKQKYK
jgi:peptide/nickel transport system substrate-binding protein